MANLKKILVMLSMVLLLTSAMLPISVVEAQDEALFEVTIIAPGNANMLRRQWGQIIANSLIQLGIDARVVYLGWTPVIQRVFEPLEENVGKTYDEGGFDIQLIGYTPDLVPNLGQLYYGNEETFAPTGSNYYLYNNTEANDLMDIYLTTSNVTERELAAKNMQTIFYNELPASIIMFTETPTAVTPELGGPALGTSPGGDGWLYFNDQPNPEMLTGKTSVVYASTGSIESLVPTLANNWYDTIIHSNIFGGLVMTAPDLSDLTVPDLLTSWVPSNNGFNWTWTCRTGVKWHDGEDFTADDVVFSLWALMNPATGTVHQGSYTIAFGDNINFKFANGTSWTVGNGTRKGWVTAVNATTIEIGLPELLPGKPYGFFDPYLLGFDNNIIPKHIFEHIAPADWATSPFNTGLESITIGGTTYTGPVGTGPYKWEDYDSVAQIVHLKKFANYWNATGVPFEVEDYYIRFIADKTPALAALKNNEVDMLDPQYQIQVDVPDIEGSTWGKVLLNKGTGVQEVGYNHQHPILGTGVDTPLGQSDSSRAAEAARYVRIAIDHAIPRQLIIDNLVAGYGEPAAVHWLPANPFYNASITPRQYNLTLAREYLELAGYTIPGPPTPPTIPSFLLGMSTQLSGVYIDPNTGNPADSRSLWLMQATNNATFNTTSVFVDKTTTDFNGWYSFTVTPSTTGVFYYYLFDELATPAETAAQWTYLTMLNASSLADALDPLNDQIGTLQNETNKLQNSINTMTYISVAALVVAIAIGAIAILMTIRKKP
ncbi:MAG: hypothetical protein JSV12_05400 [Candidatus Bathyarchaeota archaeon]|nr:MAG: hypothetical protein JSV12_05400 [Candidatus Bathyarchaeota archaeon]